MENDKQASKLAKRLSGIVLFFFLLGVVGYMLSQSDNSSPPRGADAIPEKAEFKLCHSDLQDTDVQIEKLKTLINELKEEKTPPIDCQNKLDQLLYSSGLEKAKQGEFNIGVYRFCEISDYPSVNLSLAQAQLQAWYNGDPTYQRFIKSYLETLQGQNQSCPAARGILKN